MDYIAYAYFTSLGAGKTGLTVTVDVYDHAGTLKVNGGAVTELAGGFYTYTYSAIADDDYLFKFKTTSTAVDQQQVATKTDDKTLIGADVWGYSARTLTQAAASVVSAVAGSDMTILRGDSFTANLTGLGNISTRTKLYCTVKRSKDDLDTAAIIQWEETIGLNRLNGAATTTTNGTLVVTNPTTGALTLTLKPAATVVLTEWEGYYYDVQMITATGVQTMSEGRVSSVFDVTRAIT